MTTDTRDFTGRRSVAAIFEDRADAERAIEALRESGFTRDQIGVAMRDRTPRGEMVEETGTHAAEGAGAGLLGGAALGALAGYLVATGALAIPGIGPVVAGGVLAQTFGIIGGTAVAGGAIGAAAGGILGGLVGMGIPEHEARHFEEGFRRGGTLVTVTAPGRAGEANAILERFHGDTAAARSSVPGAVETSGSDIKGADFVLRKRTVTETQTIEVPITREAYVVERQDGTVVGEPPATPRQVEDESPRKAA